MKTKAGGAAEPSVTLGSPAVRFAVKSRDVFLGLEVQNGPKPQKP